MVKPALEWAALVCWQEHHNASGDDHCQTVTGNLVKPVLFHLQCWRAIPRTLALYLKI